MLACQAGVLTKAGAQIFFQTGESTAISMLFLAGHDLDGIDEDVHLKGFPEYQSPDVPDKFFDFGITPVPGHEDESLAQGGAGALDCQIKHISRKIWHHHVAKDDFKIVGQNLFQSLGPV